MTILLYLAESCVLLTPYTLIFKCVVIKTYEKNCNEGKRTILNSFNNLIILLVYIIS